MNAVKSLFAPGGRKFYTLFNSIGSVLVEMTAMSLEILKSNSISREQYLGELKAIGQEKEHLAHRLYIELGKNFITPFDREDIYALVTSLDGIADVVWSISRRLCHYNIASDNNELHELMQELQGFLKILVRVIDALSNKKDLVKLHKHCIEMNIIIAACDSRIDALLARLYNSSDIEVIEVIKYADYYENMELLFERCQDVVNTLETIIVKYG
jgi:predicted phosphate transport protein (TIGR00153 family)